jgi:hypothetical protein
MLTLASGATALGSVNNRSATRDPAGKHVRLFEKYYDIPSDRFVELRVNYE